MEKITKKIAKVIEKVKDENLDQFDTIQELLDTNELSVDESIAAIKGFLNGYEIELTPEEKIKKEYIALETELLRTIKGSTNYYEILGRTKALKFVIETLDITI